MNVFYSNLTLVAEKKEKKEDAAIFVVCWLFIVFASDPFKEKGHQ